MRYFLILFSAIFIISCGGNSENANQPANAKSANTNSPNANANANNPLATTRTPDAPMNNNAPTLAPVLNAYYEALNKKDEAGVKRFLSQSAVKYFEDEAKSEKKSLLAYLLEAEEPLNEKREIRNEKIEGDSAVAEIKGGSLGNWTPNKFVKENGEWKFASPKESLALQDIPKTNAPANEAK